MKHTWMRAVALVMALLLLVPLATGCKNEEGSGGGTGKPLEGEVVKDMQGYSFVVYDYFKSRWQPEAGTKVNDKVLEVMDDVKTVYNCDIVFNELNVDSAFDKLQTEVAAGGKFGDLIITTMWNYGKMLGAGLMGDLNKVEGLQLDQPWWNQNVKEPLTVNGKLLGGAGSFTDHAYLTWSCYFNKALFQQMGHDPEELYTLVRNGEWTYSKFVAYAKEALKDQDGNGLVDSGDDIWGLVAPSGDYNHAAFLAMGGKFFGHDDDGNIVLACNDQHAFDVVTFMRKMFKTDKIWMSSGNESFSEIMGHFVDGHSLFIMCSPGEEQLRTMEDDYGFLPQPKWDKDQANYIGMVDHNAPLFGITSTNTDTDKIGYIMEGIARRYQQVNELTLDNWKDTIWRSDKDDEMMRNYVAGHGGYDLSPIARNANSVLGLPMDYVYRCTMGTGTDYASLIEMNAPKVDAAIESYILGTTTTANS